MKNHNEMFQSLLSRYEEHQEKKKKRILVIKRTVPVLACFCFCAVLGLGYWNHFRNLPGIPVQPDFIDKTTLEVPETTTSTVSENKSTTQVSDKIEPAFTTAPISNSETERMTTTTHKQLPTVTTVATDATDAPATEPPVVTTEETHTTMSNANIKEIKFGYDDENDIGGHQKPSASQKIIMKCISFCELGKSLTVEVAMADASLQPIFYDTAPNYEYRIYACDPLNFMDTEDERLVVNEQPKRYIQEYTSDEAAMFDIHKDTKNYDLYHHETAIIDFSGYETGASGCIVFSFLAAYTEDPLHPSYVGSNQFMYFYAGEKGTSISALGIEDAIENYQAVTVS